MYPFALNCISKGHFFWGLQFLDVVLGEVNQAALKGNTSDLLSALRKLMLV
jgi:hypothetical protein